MDNLTHSLAGAVLGQMGLKRRTGLAIPALIIGANIPDIDAIATVFGTQSLAMRRGLTHGPIALVLLPLILTGLLLAYDRWRPNPKRLPVHRGWLLAVAYIGTLSHPALDWMNSYGIRFLEPFSSQWFAGDTLFIIDVWIWTALALGVWLSQRRERRALPNWRTPAVASFAAICAYIFANGLITGRAEAMGTAAVEAAHSTSPTLVVANPVPVTFWQRELHWRDAIEHGSGTFAFPATVALAGEPARNGMDYPLVEAARQQNADARAFLFWSRMPVAKIEGEELVLSDQRFGNPVTANTFVVRVPLRSLAP